MDNVSKKVMNTAEIASECYLVVMWGSSEVLIPEDT
jgi:hypothetical protein